MNFSEKLKTLRKDKKISQEELADLLKVSRQSISKWESGETLPDTDKLLAISKLFNCRMDDLVNDKVKLKNKREKYQKVLELLKRILKHLPKYFQIIILISLILALMVLFGLLIIEVYLLIDHVPYYGPLFLIIGIIILTVILLVIDINYLKKKKIYIKLLIIPSIISIATIILGINVFAIELMKTTFYEEAGNELLRGNFKKEIKMTEDLIPNSLYKRRSDTSTFFQLIEYRDNLESIEFIENNNLNDTILLEVNYNTYCFDNINFKNENNMLVWYPNSPSEITLALCHLKQTKDNLKLRKFYVANDPQEFWFNSTIYASRKNIKVLNNNLLNYYEIDLKSVIKNCLIDAKIDSNTIEEILKSGNVQDEKIKDILETHGITEKMLKLLEIENQK